MDDKLLIKTFGGFSIQYQDTIISDQDNRSKKVWTLIKYMVLHHKNEIPINTMIELLWSDSSSTDAPLNALKVCLHRAREILSKLNYPAKSLIIYKRSTLTWNSDVPCEIDCEQFESLNNLAYNSALSTEKRMNHYKDALALYQGDFLPKNEEEDWAHPIISYYHSMYISATKNLLSLLYEKKDYEQLVTYAYQATQIDIYDEMIQYYLIDGLHKCGKIQAALSQYDYILKLLYNDFGVNPSDNLKELYLNIIKEDNATQMDLNIIQQSLKEKEMQACAYECDYSIFLHLYQIQARSMERTGLIFFLCLITLTCDKNSKKDNTPKAMDCLSEILASSLRSGDVFSRYSKNQYIVLLPSASYENATVVGERIMKRYEQTKFKGKVQISYRLRCMEPMVFEK